MKKIVILGLLICPLFADPGFDGLEQQQGNFLDQPISVIEKKAEELTVQFTEEELKVLKSVQADVGALLDKKDAKSFLNSDLQKRLLILEEDWKKREGARLIVKLLESIRIKTQNYVQNAYLLERLKEGSSEYVDTKERRDRFFDGIALTNNTLAETLNRG